jgi:hypothetical protein
LSLSLPYDPVLISLKISQSYFGGVELTNAMEVIYCDTALPSLSLS